MKNRMFLKCFGFGGLWLLAGSSLFASASPNIVFIFSDDHSLQTIGAYDARLSEFCRENKVTPNIDRLAEQGGIFQNSYCANSICSPSRATVQTGLHSHANGVLTIRAQTPIRRGTWTYPEGLRKTGYQSYLIGKWHIAKTKPTFDDWLTLPWQGDYYDPTFNGPKGKRVQEKGYVSDVITDHAIEWLEQREPEKPFFLAVHHKAPHRKWEPPLRYAEWLDDVEIPEPDSLFDDYATRTPAASKQRMSIDRDMNLKKDLKISPAAAKDPLYAKRNRDFASQKPTGRALTKWKYQQYMKDYLRCVKSVDDSVGRIVEYLEAEGLAENTVVIYSSDQGFYNGEHGWFDKRWIYEESLRMPLIIRWPGVVAPGSRFTPLVQNIDYAETFMDIAGGESPETLHGESLLPIMRGERPDDWRESVYYHYYGEPTHQVAKHYGLRTDRYTLVSFYGSGEWELYDSLLDPGQVLNVYADPQYTETVESLKCELTELRSLYGDSDALPEPTW